MYLMEYHVLVVVDINKLTRTGSLYTQKTNNSTQLID